MPKLHSAFYTTGPAQPTSSDGWWSGPGDSSSRRHGHAHSHQDHRHTHGRRGGLPAEETFPPFGSFATQGIPGHFQPWSLPGHPFGPTSPSDSSSGDEDSFGRKHHHSHHDHRLHEHHGHHRHHGHRHERHSSGVLGGGDPFGPVAEVLSTEDAADGYTLNVLIPHVVPSSLRVTAVLGGLILQGHCEGRLHGHHHHRRHHHFFHRHKDHHHHHHGKHHSHTDRDDDVVSGSHTDFRQTFAVPSYVDTARAVAHTENGIVTIRAPRREVFASTAF
ncbi:hypothetical protein IWQ60_008912 [Tieghemiomyces parasiticus]|uniref:SHSP domain-containing protein n=1 Tax=Tieghemiomyces parasiticus TaxID=78921 RepID=A0A9W8DR36_9FUNG|nr:hypothetical protein IWQ60_008912 [Tieghemiomyces parasiticus]